MNVETRSSTFLGCSHLLLVGVHVWLLLTKSGHGSPDIARVLLCLAFAALGTLLSSSHLLLAGLFFASRRRARPLRIAYWLWAAMSAAELVLSAMMAGIFNG
jgi:hypothetical protein